MRTDLKVLRVKHGLTQTDLAKMLGVSVATYCLIEQGKRRGSVENWLKIQQIFKLGDAEVWNLQK